MRIIVRGIEFNCRIEGAGSEVVVLIHGLASQLGSWDSLARHLQERYLVLRWDLRAHGGSASPPGPYSLEDLAVDLREILDALDVDSAHVLGHSAGGVVAMRFALDFPERLRSLILVSTASECNARARDFYESLARTAEQEGGEAVLALLGMDRTKDAVAPEPAGFAKIARCMGRLHLEPLTAALDRVAVPTLIVVGEKDFLGVGGSVIISRRIKKSTLKIISDRGHAIHLEDQAGFNQIVSDFLTARPQLG